MSRLLKPTNLLRNIWLVVCLLPGILSLPLTAAEPSVKTPSTSHRWLLVVDTSRAMERRSEAVQQIASNLVVSAMNGQAQPGDTLGVWTFNEELQTGRFPLQTFTSNNIPAARRLAGFLRAQPHEGSGRLPNVMPTLMHLVQSSDFITVIILSDGSSEIVGTPFDEKINASFRSWRREQARGQMPFVTLLRASLGNVTQYAVSTPPFPLEMPPLQEALVQARNEAVRAVEPVKAQPRPTPPPLIVSGRKPSTNVTQAVPQPDPQ
ncbi:MAG TPA: VWA domain-containing protein, partial [Verrucomicrobiota bacterium]|nr:VWA domain-containing protein [Verrucomicrobiota bacterium]